MSALRAIKDSGAGANEGVYRTGGVSLTSEVVPPYGRQDGREIEFVKKELDTLRGKVKGPDAIKILDEAISKAASANAHCED